MKKLNLVLLLLMSVTMVNAQHKINSFFDQMGAARLQTEELKNDTIITIFHRQDDVVWYRTVYSIIDLRFKQNYVMYYPTSFDNPRYKSLFGVMMNAIMQGTPVYAKPMQVSLQPHFEMDPEERSKIPALLELQQNNDDDGGFDLGAMDDEGMEGIDMSALTQTPSVLTYSPENDQLSVSEYYDQYVKNQFKFLIQEIIFFDKHYSRLYRKIVAIAPMYAPNASETADPHDAIYQEILFWLPFDALRPHLKSQFIITSKNSAKDITYDQFFQQHLYTSYLVGEDNMYDRMITEYVKSEDAVKKEQKRIETELLNFEQDLWEY